MTPHPAAPARVNAPSVHQTTHAVLRRDLRAGLVDAATRAGPRGVGSVLFRAAAGVYALLVEHAVDHRGCCVRCRRPGSWVGPARRRCLVYPLVHDWLYQSRPPLAARLRHDLGLPVPPEHRTVPRPGLRIVGRTDPPVGPLDAAEDTGGLLPCPR